MRAAREEALLAHSYDTYQHALSQAMMTSVARIGDKANDT